MINYGPKYMWYLFHNWLKIKVFLFLCLFLSKMKTKRFQRTKEKVNTVEIKFFPIDIFSKLFLNWGLKHPFNQVNVQIETFFILDLSRFESFPLRKSKRAITKANYISNQSLIAFLNPFSLSILVNISIQSIYTINVQWIWVFIFFHKCIGFFLQYIHVAKNLSMKLMLSQA